MNFTSGPQVSFAHVLNFVALEKRVRFDQATAEEAFGEIVGVQSQQTNIPDEFDPTQPRIMFPSERKSIWISQAACQLSLTFDLSENSYAKALPVVQEDIHTFATRATRFRSAPHFGAQALVLELRYASEETGDDLSQYLHTRFIKTNAIGAPASFQLQLGYKYDDLYLNLMCSPYETRKLPDVGPTMSFLRADTLPVIERGIQIRIEANNILSSGSSDISVVPKELLNVVEKFVKEHFTNIVGLPI